MPSPVPRDPKHPARRVARLASMWGWSYIITLVALYWAPSTPPGPLRFLVFNFSILLSFVGILELFWRHRLLVTGEARWVRALAFNQVGGTLTLLWNLYLIYVIPPKVLVGLISAADRVKYNHLTMSMANRPLTDSWLEASFAISKTVTLYGFGGLLLLSQIWVISRYLRFYFEMQKLPAIPPVLK
jgi:hypothetical protein